MTVIQPTPLLRTALRIDAAGSAPIGLLQTAVPAWLAAHTGLAVPLLAATGLFTLAYAALLLWLARKPRLPLATVRFIVIGNLGWAVASVVLAALLDGLTPWGVGYLAFHAVAVTCFATLQGVGLARSHAAPPRAAQGVLA